MDNIFSIINLAKIGLTVEKAKAEVSSHNIANIHKSGVEAREVNFEKLLTAMQEAEKSVFADSSSPASIDTDGFVDKKANGKVNLDQEVSRLTDAEMRYQVIAQTIQKKFGLMDLVIGGKSK